MRGYAGRPSGFTVGLSSVTEEKTTVESRPPRDRSERPKKSAWGGPSLQPGDVLEGRSVLMEGEDPLTRNLRAQREKDDA